MREITPPAGLPMGGYAARAAPSSGTLDPLYCRAAVFADASSAVALVALDLLHLSGPWAAEARARAAVLLGGPPDRVLVAAIHTHSGPAVFGSAADGDLEAMRAYEARVADELVESVRQARVGAAPASLLFGSASAGEVGRNRRDAAGEIDDAVRVLVARGESGSLLGVTAVFGCHPTVLPPENTLYSRDLFGAAIEGAEERLGAPVALFNGAAADVSTRFTRREPTPAEVRRLGSALAEGIERAVAGARPLGGAELKARLDTVAVHLRPPVAVDEAQARLEEAQRRLESLRSSGAAPGALRLATSVVEGAAVQLLVSTHGGFERLIGRRPETAPLQVLRIAGADVLAVPGEMLSVVGRRVCAARSRPSLLIGYANDYLGYLIPEDAAAGYEALVAALAPQSAADLADRLAAMELG